MYLKPAASFSPSLLSHEPGELERRHPAVWAEEAEGWREEATF